MSINVSPVSVLVGSSTSTLYMPSDTESGSERSTKQYQNRTNQLTPMKYVVKLVKYWLDFNTGNTQTVFQVTYPTLRQNPRFYNRIKTKVVMKTSVANQQTYYYRLDLGVSGRVHSSVNSVDFLGSWFDIYRSKVLEQLRNDLHIL